MVKYTGFLFIVLLIACDSIDSESTNDPHLSEAARRIELPAKTDTLYVVEPFRLKAFVECHDPIVGLRVEFTDASKPQGDGNVLAEITFPARGTTEVSVDTLLSVPVLREKTTDNEYGFILVEVYEDQEFRAGFEPVVILD